VSKTARSRMAKATRSRKRLQLKRIETVSAVQR
jgi:hypothetical protein